MHEITHIQVEKSQILKWHHVNVGVACLSAEEVHTPPGDPRDKLLPMKTFKNRERKYQESLWKSPENLDSREKSHLWCAGRSFR